MPERFHRPNGGFPDWTDRDKKIDYRLDDHARNCRAAEVLDR